MMRMIFCRGFKNCESNMVLDESPLGVYFCRLWVKS
jgi:hypothetical protein